jgi:hypothetical protein
MLVSRSKKQMTTQQSSKVLPAIKAMEKICKYFYWLEQQAPVTGLFYDFDTLVGAV